MCERIFETDAEPEEPITRYVLHSAWIRTSDTSVRKQAFMPRTNKDNNLDELSTYRTDGFDKNRIREIGDSVVADTPNNLYGHASTIASKFLEKKLRLETDNKPLPGHTNVVGWPADKPSKMAISEHLAKFAKLTLY